MEDGRIPLETLERDAKGCVDGIHAKNLLHLELWTDSLSSRAISQRLTRGTGAKHLEAHTMWVQQVSKQNILQVHITPADKNQTDVLTNHVPRAVLDKLSESLELAP